MATIKANANNAPGRTSRTDAQPGMSMGDLARYLMVSRQNLSGLISRMERDGHVTTQSDARDRRSRLVCMTEPGRKQCVAQATPKIEAYYEAVPGNFSSDDMTHTLRYLLKLLDNMKRVDERERVAQDDA